MGTEVIISEYPEKPRLLDRGENVKPDMILIDAANNCKYFIYKYPGSILSGTANNHKAKILRVKKEVEPLLFNVTRITFMYPFGCAGYNFDYKHIMDYEYNFESKR